MGRAMRDAPERLICYLQVAPVNRHREWASASWYIHSCLISYIPPSERTGEKGLIQVWLLLRAFPPCPQSPFCTHHPDTGLLREWEDGHLIQGLPVITWMVEQRNQQWNGYGTWMCRTAWCLLRYLQVPKRCCYLWDRWKRWHPS